MVINQIAYQTVVLDCRTNGLEAVAIVALASGGASGDTLTVVQSGVQG
jgi:hypothetical protein